MKKLLKYSIALNLFLLLNTLSFAQVYEQYPPYNIQSIQFESSDGLSQLPVFNLGNHFKLRFDDLDGDEKNYYYRIQHYNFDWKPSRLSKNDYLEGFDETRIKNYANSQNTYKSYSHYELSIPNSDTKALKRSGNYMLEILDQDFNVVFSKKFMIAENLARVGMEIKRSKNIKDIEKIQVVHFKVLSDDIIFNNPSESVKVSLYQNANIYTGIHDLKPQYTTGNELIYRYNNETAFPAGNEYVFFDSKDIRATANGIQKVLISDIYDHYLYIDQARKNRIYSRNPDINGSFVVRNIDASNPNTGADYTRVHFSLAYDQNIGDKEIHIYGGFNNFNIDDTTYMQWNPERGLYEGSRLFKQGFYNYKYVTIDANGYIDESEIEGDFWQTENQYSLLVYYREVGGRYDRLIGIGQANSENITN